MLEINHAMTFGWVVLLPRETLTRSTALEITELGVKFTIASHGSTSVNKTFSLGGSEKRARDSSH